MLVTALVFSMTVTASAFAAPLSDSISEREISSVSPLSAPVGDTASENNEKVIDLYRGKTGENEPFICTNMLPGDSVSRFFRLKVTHTGETTVSFSMRYTSESVLAEILCVKVTLSTTGEVMYDGLISEMPTKLEHKIAAEGTQTSQVVYQVTVYMPTEATAEYMGKTVTAEFEWSAPEVETLATPTWHKVAVAVPTGVVISGSLTVFIIARLRRLRSI